MLSFRDGSAVLTVCGGGGTVSVEEEARIVVGRLEKERVLVVLVAVAVVGWERACDGGEIKVACMVACGGLRRRKWETGGLGEG